MRQVTPPRYLTTMLDRIRVDDASTGAGVPHVTFETVDEALPNDQFMVLGVPLTTTGNGQNVQVGQQVPVAWKDGKPLVIIDHHAQAAQPIRGLPSGGSIVEELLIAETSNGELDVWFRNDQQVSRLHVDEFLVAGTPTTTQVGWGLSPDSFFVAVGDPNAPTPSFKVHVFTINRTPNRLIGSGHPAATFSYTWQASTTTLHLSTINFDGQLYGAWSQLNQARLVLMNWTDTLEIEFQDMLSKNLLKFKSIVLDEDHNVNILFSADVEQRRIGFSPTFPRSDSPTHFHDLSESPTLGGWTDAIPSFLDGPPSSFFQDVTSVAEADFNPNGDKHQWIVDPGVHFFVAKVTSAPPKLLWRTIRDPFNFVWRKVWTRSLTPDSATAISNRLTTGTIFYGVANWVLFLEDRGFISTGGAVGDLVNGLGPGTVNGQTIKGGATFRDPVDTGMVGFADGEQENLTEFTGTLLGAAPQQSINEQFGPYAYDFGGAGGLGAGTFTAQATYTRTLQKLWRDHKWNFNTQTPQYLGRRVLSSKGDPTYKGPAVPGVVAIVGERTKGASGFTYIPVTILQGAPILVDDVALSPGPGDIKTFWPYPATTRDSITGSEDFTGQRQEWIEGVDVKTSVSHLLAPVTTKAGASPTFVVTFGVSNEFHIQWTQFLGAIGAIFLSKISSSEFIQVGSDVPEYLSHNFLILRPNQFYEANESKLRFVRAWDANTGVPTLMQPTSATQSYPNDPKLLNRGTLKKTGVTPVNAGSYVAIDDRTTGVNLRPRN